MKINLIIIFFLINLWSLNAQVVYVNNSYEKGEIKDGYKDSIWEYSDNHELNLKIDYSSGKIKYLAKDTSYYAIKTDTGWIYTQLDVYPRYIGSYDEIMKILTSNIDYPMDAKTRSIHGTVFISFIVNLDGHASNIEIIRDIGGGCGNEVLKAFNMVPNFWITAYKDKKYYESRFILPVKFKLGKDWGNGIVWEKESKKETKDMIQDMLLFPEAKKLDEVVISAVGFVRQ